MKRLFSGIQPTGEIHIGNYLGAIKNWVELQEKYECIYCIVDMHAITIEYDVSQMQARIIRCATDLLACGIDPAKSLLFVQSKVPQHTELAWILNTVTPIGELERMTQFKDKSKQHRENINSGLFTYPVLQTADIILYKAEMVPVGEDQVQHIELAREIVRKFHARYGEVFPEPKALTHEAKRILGLDGKNKMSKSMNNYISLMDDQKQVWEKVRNAVTDPQRMRKNDPGNPDICNVQTLDKFFSPKEQIEMVDRECRKGTIGCVEHKKMFAESLSKHLAPIQERAKELNANPDKVRTILNHSAEKCHVIAEQTITEVKTKMGLL
jgi:tryptophanyl-tRNA synthetase